MLWMIFQRRIQIRIVSSWRMDEIRHCCLPSTRSSSNSSCFQNVLEQGRGCCRVSWHPSSLHHLMEETRLRPWEGGAYAATRSACQNVWARDLYMFQLADQHIINTKCLPELPSLPRTLFSDFVPTSTPSWIPTSAISTSKLPPLFLGPSPSSFDGIGSFIFPAIFSLVPWTDNLTPVNFNIHRLSSMVSIEIP